MQELDNEINVKGWVRNKRGSKNVAFIALNDGSTINNLQLVIDLEKIPEENLALMHAGASVSAIGKLVKSAGSGQNVELSVSSIELLGPANPDFSASVTPWCSPSITSSTARASTTSIPRLSQHQTLKAPARCSR